MNKTIYTLSHLLRKFGYSFNEESDLRVQTMTKSIRSLNGKVNFTIEQYPDGSWYAESTNLQGIVTGGENAKDMLPMIKDAIFTYFEIPPHLCNDQLLHSDAEPVKMIREVYV